MSVSASNSSKFQVKPTIQIHGFIQESQIVNYCVEELYASTDGSTSLGNPTRKITPHPWEFWSEPSVAEESDEEGKIEELIERLCDKVVSGEGGASMSENGDQIPEAEVVGEVQMESKIEKTTEKPNDSNPEKDGGSESLPEVRILGEDYWFSPSNSDSESVSSDNGFSEGNHHSIYDEISDDNDDSEGLELQVAIEGQKLQTDEFCFSGDVCSEDKFYISEDDEYIELKPHFHVSYSKVLPVNDYNEVDDVREMENSVEKERENEDRWGKSEKIECEEKGLNFEKDYEDEMEFLEEHQGLIEQLKMELRNSRTGGLTTILEEEAEAESVSPNLVQSFKPLKNDVHFEYKEQLKEIQRVYKIYAEKMRKLDVLNSQTMHAIGFLNLKDPVNSIGGWRSPLRAVKSLISRSQYEGEKPSDVPNSSLLRDLNRDLELVYVGHLCLSWELLHWQHGKALQLQQNDSQHAHQYNRAVNKFQLFCVLLQRFIEDERFQGPRTENYIKNRRFLHSLLQVPAIREDCSKDNKTRERAGENANPIGALVQIIEDSMRLFGEFLRTDKDIGNSMVKCAQTLHQIDLQNSADAQLMLIEIRADLQKKEKRLKDIQRSGNCIVKKLKRNEEGSVNKALFIAEVELRLVSRVVRMSKLSDSQLLWCIRKLHQLNFVNGKVVVEPSFLLFPC